MRWLIILIASACGGFSYTIPEEPVNNEADPFVSGCNATKSCFLVPDSCLTTGSCRAGVAVAVTGDRFQFEIMAVDSVYVAVGLSDDAFMGKDSVVECIYDVDAVEKGVQIFVSFNDGTTNTRIKTSAAENGVKLVTGSFVNGVIRCTFMRENSTRAEGLVFDLAKRQYHLLVAAGSKLHPYGIAFHDREASGSRNGRLMADVGMFVNPDSASIDDQATSTPGGESSYEHDAVKEAEDQDHALDDYDSATSTPGGESSFEHDAAKEAEDQDQALDDYDLATSTPGGESSYEHDAAKEAENQDQALDDYDSATSTPGGESSFEHDAAKEAEDQDQALDDYDSATSTPGGESSFEHDAAKEAEDQDQALDDYDSATSTPGGESSFEHDAAEEAENQDQALDEDDQWNQYRPWNEESGESEEIEVECYDYDNYGDYGVEIDDATEKDFTVHGCNETKSCFLVPPSCLHTAECTLAVSVRQTTNGFEFEMHAADSVYVAVALSTDAVMGSDSVVECVTTGANITGYTSWNKGHKNHRIHEPLSKSGITLLEGSAGGGNIYCKFTRDANTTEHGVVFDLTKSKFHLLMASGSRLKDHGIGFHDRGYAGSYAGRLLGDVGMFSQSRRRDMIDEPEEGDVDADADADAYSYELADAFRPIVTIV